MGLKCWLGLNHDTELQMQDRSGFSSCALLPNCSYTSRATAKAGGEKAGKLQRYFNALSPNHSICLLTELSSLVPVSEQDSHHLLHWKCKISVNALLTDRITFVSCCSSSGSALKSAVLLRPVSAHLPPSFPVSIQRAH